MAGALPLEALPLACVYGQLGTTRWLRGVVLFHLCFAAKPFRSLSVDCLKPAPTEKREEKLRTPPVSEG